jgi:hypothetical protein
MRIPGHSSAGGRHGAGRYGAGRQQDRVRDATQKQEGRHILPVDSHSEVQAEFGTVTGTDGSNRLTARHRFAF